MDILRKREMGLYAGVWAVIFALAPATMFFHYMAGHDGSVSWAEILDAWGNILPYLLLFVVHDFLSTSFIRKRQMLLYLLVTLSLLVAFGVYCYSTGHRPPGPPMDGMGGPPAMPEDGRRPLQPETMRLIIAVLVVLGNLGVKAMFAALGSERKVQDLKAESLNRQLETLRYQINPHFFMNTLNNIHALVDVDPEKAKESIQAFSKLMRIVLYEGDSPTIPLEHEANYIRHYISLMRLRYPETVIIDLALPQDTAGAKVPPLLMASFVENAFKHGISYEEHSFVHVSMTLKEEKIYFKCANSRHVGKADTQAGGIGMQNVRERLDLLYGGLYTLNLTQTDKVYEILLILPQTC